MIYGLKPFNSAEMRTYLDILNEAPQPTDQQAADLDAAAGQAAQGVDKFSQGNYAKGAVDIAKGANAVANAAGMNFWDKLKAGWMAIKAGAAAATTKGDPMYAAMGSVGANLMDPLADFVNSPNFEKNFLAGLEAARNNPKADAKLKQMVADYDAKKLTPASYKAYVQRMIATNKSQQAGQKVDSDADDNYEVREDQVAEIRKALDMLEADDGSKVTVDPATGQKTVIDAEGTKVYDKNGQLISQSSPSVGGLQQTKNVQTGRTTTDYKIGGLDVTQSTGGGVPTVTSATTDVGPQTATVHSGVGFGGAGKDVQAPVSVSITDKATGKTTNIVGRLPTAKDMTEAEHVRMLMNKLS
jgi:hypothetical protein